MVHCIRPHDFFYYYDKTDSFQRAGFIIAYESLWFLISLILGVMISRL